MKNQRISATDSFVRRIPFAKHSVALLFGRRLLLAVLVLATLLVGAGTFEAGDAHAAGELQGRFVNVPKNHSQKPFTIQLRFNNYVVTKPKDIVGFRNPIKVSGGHITKAERLDVITEDGKQLSKKFRLTVKPMEIQSGRVPNIKLMLLNRGSCAKKTVFCTKDDESNSRKVAKTIRFKVPPADKLTGVRSLSVTGGTSNNSGISNTVKWRKPEVAKYLSGYELFWGSSCSPGGRVRKITPTHEWTTVHLIGKGYYSVRPYGMYGKGPCKSAEGN